MMSESLAAKGEVVCRLVCIGGGNAWGLASTGHLFVCLFVSLLGWFFFYIVIWFIGELRMIDLYPLMSLRFFL